MWEAVSDSFYVSIAPGITQNTRIPIKTGQRDASIATCIILNNFFEGQLPHELINKIVDRVPLDFEQFKHTRDIQLTNEQSIQLYNRVAVELNSRELTLRGGIKFKRNMYGYLSAVDKNGNDLWSIKVPEHYRLRDWNRKYLVIVTENFPLHLCVIDANGKFLYISKPLDFTMYNVWIHDNQVLLVDICDIVHVWDFVLPSPMNPWQSSSLSLSTLAFTFFILWSCVTSSPYHSPT